MSREQPPLPPDDLEDPPEPEGRLQPTGPAPLVILGLVGLVIGWVLRGQAIREDAAAPTVSWIGVGATWFVAAAIGGIAYLTWRTVQRERRLLTAQQGLARLVLGRTMSRLGAFAFGGFLGSAISHLGVAGESAQSALTRAALAAVGAAAALAAGLLLEHACRVPRDD